MLTSGQRQELTRIAEQLKRDVHNHPSETFRESFAGYTREQIDGTVAALRRIYATDNGYLAYRVISIEMHKCLAGVVNAFLEGQLKSKKETYD